MSMIRRLDIIFGSVVAVLVGTYLVDMSLLDFTTHAAVVLAKSHATIRYDESPGRYIFVTTVTGLFGITASITGTLGLIKVLCQQPGQEGTD
jgi:hypothetical protein